MSAQLEDGYTMIANELLERLPKFKLNGTQLRVIMIVWRYTYGFKRKDHEMSLSFFVKATGLGKTQIDRELTNLIENKVLVVTEESTYTKSRKLGFNKHLDDWKLECSQQKEVQSAKMLTVSENADEQSAETRTPTVSKNADQERKPFKENLKQTQEEEPRTAMDAYLFSFKKMHYTGHIGRYVMELMSRGFTDTFIREVFMEMGARGIKEDERYMKKMAEDWISRGIYTRVQAEQAKEKQKSNLHHFSDHKKEPMSEADTEKIYFQRWVNAGNDPSQFVYKPTS